MARLEKLIEHLRRHPPEAAIGDVEHVLVAFGWERLRQKGSHVTFAKDGERAITVPLRGGTMVGRTYVDEICKRLGLDRDQD